MSKIITQLDNKALEIETQFAESMPGGFFIYRANGDENFIYVNNATLRIFGCQSEGEFRALTKNSFKHMVHPDDIEEVEKSIKEQIEKSIYDLDYVEYRIIRKDGQIRWIVDYGRFVHTKAYGDVFYVFIDDATEKKRLEEEAVKKLLVERERDNAIHANNAKSAFLFNMSHDIKTPINAIAGFAELAQKNIDGDKKRLYDYLEKIKISSDLLVELINDILSMTEIESGSLSLNEEPCDLQEQIDLLTNIFRPQIANKNLHYNAELNIERKFILADALNLKRALSNILQNAVNFTNAGGSISLAVSQSPSLQENCFDYKFTISDTGCGMSAEFMQRIYIAFEREQNTTASHIAGTGLGLTITKYLIEMMRGKIEVQSQVGKGTTFTITIPFKTCDKAAVEKTRESEENIRAKNSGKKISRILVVEDNELNREIILEILGGGGFEVEASCDGIEAVEQFSSHPQNYYDLILMDIQMPRMNGYEATEKIRALERDDAKTIPIFAITANTLENDKRQAYKSGIDKVIEKPVNLNSFSRMLESL